MPNLLRSHQSRRSTKPIGFHFTDAAVLQPADEKTTRQKKSCQCALSYHIKICYYFHKMHETCCLIILSSLPLLSAGQWTPSCIWWLDCISVLKRKKRDFLKGKRTRECIFICVYISYSKELAFFLMVVTTPTWPVHPPAAKHSYSVLKNVNLLPEKHLRRLLTKIFLNVKNNVICLKSHKTVWVSVSCS